MGQVLSVVPVCEERLDKKHKMTLKAWPDADEPWAITDLKERSCVGGTLGAVWLTWL